SSPASRPLPSPPRFASCSVEDASHAGWVAAIRRRPRPPRGALLGYPVRVGGPLWRVGDRELDCSARTLLMGILNVTPDSFSDGGRFLDHEAAVRRGVEMAGEGADLVDVGGESTRPGSDPVSPADEIDRVVPVIKRLDAELEVPISIDT